MEPLKIVVRYADRRILKGYTNDFFPDKPSFHLFQNRLIPTKWENIILEEVKAVFIVKDFKGNPSRDKSKTLSNEEIIHGRKVKVTFTDGETLVGTTISYDPHKLGFFLFPMDPQSNNLRVFVVFKAAKNILFP